VTAAAFTAEQGISRAPLTWGQRALLTAVKRRGPSSSTLISIRRIVAVPRRASGDVTSVLRAISALIERHSSLRTLIHFEEGIQEVLAVGKQPVTLVPADATDPDGVATANELAWRLADNLFDHQRELPQRIALVMTGEQVRQIVLVFSHTTADFQAIERVLRDLRQLLLRGEIPGRAGPQSADIGLDEATDRRQRRSERATRYWVTSFRRLPTETLPEVGPAHQPRWQRCLLTSAAVDVAVRLLARTHQVTSSTVLLTAVAGTFARWSRADTCGIYTMVNNRAVDGHQDAVAKLNQLGMVVVDLSDRPSFATALPRVWHAALEAYRHAYYDPQHMVSAFEAAGLRYMTGVSPHCYINDIRLSPADTDLFGRDVSEASVREAMRHSKFTLAEAIDNFTWRLRMEIVDAPAGLGLALTGDTAYLPPPVAERFLRDVEELLIEAAFREVPWPWHPSAS